MKKEKCFDLGTIQAFTDGELTSDLSENVIKHIAMCDSCALLLTETEEESAFAFSVLDEELNCLVPTERLRTKVFDSIKALESEEKVSWWQKVTESLGLTEGFSFKSPSLVAFASVVLFVSVFAIGVNFYQPIPSDIKVAEVIQPITSPVDVRDIVPPNDNTPTDYKKTSVDGSDVSGSKQVFNASSSNQLKVRAIKTSGKNREGISTPKPTKPTGDTIIEPDDVIQPVTQNLSGEDRYLQTIANLSRTVDTSKDLTLRPTERIAFEKDMAVVDDAIRKMKNEVRKNPKNQAAREVLRASYQNKIDLLNSVAEKTEMMASIQ